MFGDAFAGEVPYTRTISANNQAGLWSSFRWTNIFFATSLHQRNGSTEASEWFGMWRHHSAKLLGQSIPIYMRQMTRIYHSCAAMEGLSRWLGCLLAIASGTDLLFVAAFPGIFNCLRQRIGCFFFAPRSFNAKMRIFKGFPFYTYSNPRKE